MSEYPYMDSKVKFWETYMDMCTVNAGLPAAEIKSLAAYGSPAAPPIRDWRHLWIKLSLSLGHSVKPPAAPQERPTKPPDGEWSESLKSCLTRTPSPGTIPLDAHHWIGRRRSRPLGTRVAMNVNIPKSLWRSLADMSGCDLQWSRVFWILTRILGRGATV